EKTRLRIPPSFISVDYIAPQRWNGFVSGRLRAARKRFHSPRCDEMPLARLHVALCSPEVHEARWAQCGVAGCIHDRNVAEPVLDRPGVDPIVGQLVAAGVPQPMPIGHHALIIAKFEIPLMGSRSRLGQPEPPSSAPRRARTSGSRF